MKNLNRRHILLAVTGGIAAYKACELVRLLRKADSEVQVIMTAGATKLVGIETFRALSGRPVAVELFSDNAQHLVKHIDLADWADLAVVAPCTTNTLGKLVHGIADNLVTTVLQAVTAPVLLCPSANVHMMEHPAVQANLKSALEMGYHVQAPGVGDLACGYSGVGRMAEPQEIFDALDFILAPSTPWRGKRVLITAGPTREPVDAVRVITNRSSGRMGLALAEAALALGAEVDLVLGPVALEPPRRARLHPVETALEMHEAALKLAPEADIIIGAAAVSDYRLSTPVENKLKRNGKPLSLSLVPNPDILADIGRARRKGQVLIGFALETDNGLANARAKLLDKSLDIVVLNDAREPGAGFETLTNHVSLVYRDGRAEDVPMDSKTNIAKKILAAISPFLSGQS